MFGITCINFVSFWLKMIKMKNKTLLKANWLEEDQFKSWLTIAKDENKARCNCARKTSSYQILSNT